MTDIMNTLFENTESIGVIPESEHNNHIITESIILNRVNGDKDKLGEVLASVGNYAVRDNLLESAQIVEACNPVNECGDPCVTTAVLATAKEANDPCYSTYCKAYMLTKKLMHEMKNKYGNNAVARVDELNKVVDNTPRLVTAINTVNDACCK